jgi:hypothetical protein
LPKVERLELGTTKCTSESKHAFVNNWLFRIKWGFRFRTKGNTKWMKKKLWKSWMKKLNEYLTWVYFGFIHHYMSRLLIILKSISGQKVISRYQKIQYLRG